MQTFIEKDIHHSVIHITGKLDVSHINNNNNIIYCDTVYTH